MKTRTLVGALVAAGVIGGGVVAAIEPIANANATPVLVAGVAAPAANPNATTLPLNGFSDLVKRHGLQPHLLDLRNSGDTAGDGHRVVGYAAFSFEPAAA